MHAARVPDRNSFERSVCLGSFPTEPPFCVSDVRLDAKQPIQYAGSVTDRVLLPPRRLDILLSLHEKRSRGVHDADDTVRFVVGLGQLRGLPPDTRRRLGHKLPAGRRSFDAFAVFPLLLCIWITLVPRATVSSMVLLLLFSGLMLWKASRWFFWGRFADPIRVANALLEIRLCPACLYDLSKCTMITDARMLCPECGAAWSLKHQIIECCAGGSSAGATDRNR